MSRENWWDAKSLIIILSSFKGRLCWSGRRWWSLLRGGGGWYRALPYLLGLVSKLSSISKRRWCVEFRSRRFGRRRHFCRPSICLGPSSRSWRRRRATLFPRRRTASGRRWWRWCSSSSTISAVGTRWWRGWRRIAGALFLLLLSQKVDDEFLVFANKIVS